MISRLLLRFFFFLGESNKIHSCRLWGVQKLFSESNWNQKLEKTEIREKKEMYNWEQLQMFEKNQKSRLHNSFPTEIFAFSKTFFLLNISNVSVIIWYTKYSQLQTCHLPSLCAEFKSSEMSNKPSFTDIPSNVTTPAFSLSFSLAHLCVLKLTNFVSKRQI